jgi:hypothetical protein
MLSSNRFHAFLLREMKTIECYDNMDAIPATCD